MKEKFIRWEPVTNLKKKYWCTAIVNNETENFRIELVSCENEKLLVIWDGFIESYRDTDEGGRYALCDNKEIMEWTFFKVENSEYIGWLKKQSCGMYDDYKFVHFCFVCGDSIIDVISEFEPTFKFL